MTDWPPTMPPGDDPRAGDPISSLHASRRRRYPGPVGDVLETMRAAFRFMVATIVLLTVAVLGLTGALIYQLQK